ncbi:hypothetical protein [Arenibaculum pallidiluteum]|uniref:hypothetical protein n=1 Tax=Arenibaculum pallidiluteum TaxID=2812559 RepID=UPI001A95ECFB|nr:hypothetical protein [Arenibaculum pallidiluteum]
MKNAVLAPLAMTIAVAVLAGCADDQRRASTTLEPVSVGAESPLKMQPSRRNPTGYSGRPVDSSPTTLEVEDGIGSGSGTGIGGSGLTSY